MSAGLTEKQMFMLAEIMIDCNTNAVEKGFWEDNNTDAEKLLLIHSEISEAAEAIRSGDPESVKIPGHSQYAEELADAVIRIFDLAIQRRIPLSSAISAKMKYNAGRPHKHGKKF